MTVAPGGSLRKKRRRMSGMTWMFLGLLIFFIAAGAFTAIVKQIPRNIPVRVSVNAPKSYVGVDNFETTDGGVTFANVEPPDGPADKAGLVGGDIITTVDGQAINSDDQLRDIMRQLPIGKTIDVVYLRDGESKTTKLTSISKAELDRLNEVFDNRPEGRGQFGYEDNEAERVAIPNTKMFGVQLGEILPNRPADLAGIKQGDIVIQFGDVPIRTSDELLSRVRRALPYSTVTIGVMRNGERLDIPVKFGKQG
jgi:S1-C subfamily serine protease